jgi:hypothetical protein
MTSKQLELIQADHAEAVPGKVCSYNEMLLNSRLGILTQTKMLTKRWDSTTQMVCKRDDQEDRTNSNEKTCQTNR